jgi:Flp pilus assembly protein TadG
MQQIKTRLRREGGQSVVEFAFVLPFLVVLLLAIWQVGVAFYNYLAITDAARVGARYAAVSPIGTHCSDATSRIFDPVSSPLSAKQRSDASVSCTPAPATGQALKFTITHPVTVGLGSLPGIGFLGFTGTMSSTASERHE